MFTRLLTEGDTIMAKIIPFNGFIGDSESSTHKKSHLSQPVNPYKTIQILKRIIKLQRQGICLLTQELSEVKRQ